MKVLYVVGSNLSKNTSANISHNAYVQGLLENGCDVDIIMPNSSWGENDSSLPEWKEAQYYTYNAISKIDRLKKIFKTFFEKNQPKTIQQNNANHSADHIKSNPNWKAYIRSLFKSIYRLFTNKSNPYNLSLTWLKNASKFKSNSIYDLIISNSSPASSHKLVSILLSKKRIKGKRWVQIWEDPWYYDLYGGQKEQVKIEEHQLLKAAQEIFYVSPLTLLYQKKHFQDCAHKMYHITLPFLQYSENAPSKFLENFSFGYFGDYYSITRDLKPFYEAMVKLDRKAYIYGDTDIDLKSTSKVEIKGRVTLNELAKIQEKCGVLVHLCNLKGGQIPGKIYHYSATTKPILFILDGTDKEKKIIKDYFMQFQRYYFCDNKKNDIIQTINNILHRNNNISHSPIIEFQPKQVISKLLNKGVS